MPEFIDFDAADEEAEGEPIPLKVCGVEYLLPASPTARSMMRVRRLQGQMAALRLKEESGKLTDADADTMIEIAESVEIEQLLGGIIGAHIVTEWLDNGVTDAKLKAVFKYLWGRYNGQDPEAPKANRAARRASSRPTRSSSTGQRSKRTSNASTASTSRKK